MSNDWKRRDFLRGTTAAAALAGPALISARGQNQKVNVGWIGVGTRGNAGIGWLHDASANDVNLAAVCDTFEGYIARAKDRVKTVWGNMPATYKDYHDLLANKSIDAVYIMTPEHLHHDMAIAALRAGKHVYLEKPLAHTIEEGWDIIDAWKKSGKICQIGTQNRSSSLYKKAKEMIRQGMIGDVHYVRAFWYRNGAEPHPAPGTTAVPWRYVIPSDATPQNTDWNRFLGPAPKRPWDPHRYFQWRLYWDYSGGISTDLLVHQTDIVNFMLDKTVPSTCMASGGIYRWNTDDDRDAPDTLSAIYDYADRFHLNYSCYLGNVHFGYGEEVFGNEGTIRVLNRMDLEWYPEIFDPKNPPQKQPIHINGPETYHERDGAVNHFRNFINAILGKEQVVAPPPVGQQAAISGHMATLSFKHQKKIVWNESARNYHFV